uniref:Uncharacterized protein n=1 Tax=Cyanothece sp. (strain PCC 7425 / ATCC 29141) TaxID=395961 RepID=B8HK12_CYAP4
MIAQSRSPLADLKMKSHSANIDHSLADKTVLRIVDKALLAQSGGKDSIPVASGRLPSLLPNCKPLFARLVRDIQVEECHLQNVEYLRP